MDRWSKFTERARLALQYAQEEARGLHHHYIGTEHLLLGLVRVEEGVAAKALANLGAEPANVRKAVEFIISRGTEQVDGEIGMTPRAKKVMELTVDEARRLNHHYVGTEHLLLGLLREGEGVAMRVLTSLGITLEGARDEVTRILSQSMPPAQASKRYNLVVPDSLFREVQELADRQGTTVVEVLRRFIKLGLLATQVMETPGSALVIREGEREREIVLL